MHVPLLLALIACHQDTASTLDTDSDRVSESDPSADSDASDSDSDTPTDTDVLDTDHPPPTPPTVDAVIAIDRSVVLGDVQPLTGVNKSLLLTTRSSHKTFDFTSLFQTFGVTSVRLHDGPVDVCKIYTDDSLRKEPSGEALDANACSFTPSSVTAAAEWSANNAATVDNAANYDFRNADEAVDAVVDGGFEWMLRLGESYDGPNDASDPAIWAKVAGNIYSHYAIGWPAATADFARAAAWVEIYNEPDAIFWNGTDADYLALYEATWDETHAVGRPGFTPPGIGGSGFTVRGTSHWVGGTTGLISEFVSSEVPDRLEFFSMHHYGDCDTATPFALGDFLAGVRAKLDLAGGTDIPLLLTEWNIGLGGVCGDAMFSTPQAAAYLGAALALQQNPSLNLVRSYYYSGAPPMSLFDMDDASNSFTVTPAAYALRAHATLEGQLIQTRLCSADGASCLAPLAASGAGEPVHAVVAKGSDGAIRAVLANYADAARTVSLRIDSAESMPGDWEVYRAQHGGAPVAVAGSSSGGRIVPTPAGLNAANAKWGAEAVSPVGAYVPVALGPWEVVAVVGR